VVELSEANLRHIHVMAKRLCFEDPAHLSGGGNCLSINYLIRRVALARQIGSEVKVRVATRFLLIGPELHPRSIPRTKPSPSTFHRTGCTETKFLQTERTFLSVISRLETPVVCFACFNTFFCGSYFMESFARGQIIPVFPVLRYVR